MEIRINTRLAEAPAAGQTIFQYDRHATGAEAYRLVAEEFLLRAVGSQDSISISQNGAAPGDRAAT